MTKKGISAQISEFDEAVGLVIAALRSLPRGLTKEYLADIRKTHLAKFDSKVTWESKDLEPERPATWERLIYNDQRKQTSPSPNIIGRRVELLVIEIFKFIDRRDLESAEPSNVEAWTARMQEILQLLIKTSSRRADLAFIPTIDRVLDRVDGLSVAATTVYNTVFARAEPGSKHIRNLTNRLKDIQRRALRSGETEWIDLVLENEKHEYENYLIDFAKDERRSLTTVLIPTDLPLIQGLVLRYESGEGAAFVGWAFPGSSNWRVYFSEERGTVDYFFDYCRALHLRFRSKSGPAPSGP